MSSCPRCQGALQESTDHGARACGQCGGAFLPAGAIGPPLSEAIPKAAPAPSEAPPILCPGCDTAMELLTVLEFTIDRCTSCEGVWLDAAEQGNPADSTETQFDRVRRSVLYSLSLPERTLRSVVTAVAGSTFEVASVVVPQAFQKSTTYKAVVRNSLQFLIENVGGKQAEEGASSDTPDGYVARKAVGNFLDLAGMMTLHVSPMWALAIVSDVAYGSKTYVRELAAELRSQGLIDDDSSIDHIDDVFHAVESATGKASSLFDTPPLQVAELKKTLDQTRAAITSVNVAEVLPEQEIARTWEEMRALAKREDLTMFEVSGAVAMHGFGKVADLGRGALTGVRVAGNLFDRHVVDHYRSTLTEMRQKGLFTTVRETAEPYLDAVWDNFSSERESFTEKLVSGKLFDSAYQSVTSWWRRRSSSDS